MSEPATENVEVPKIVRLGVQETEDWYAISCQVCHTVVMSGEKQFLQHAVHFYVALVAEKHIHPGS